MRKYLLLISLLVSFALRMHAETLEMMPNDSAARYTVYIEMPKAYISGICVLCRDGNEIKGSIFNEFGVSAVDFSYDVTKKKIKILSVIGFLDKWYIKRVLKADLKQLMLSQDSSKLEYYNKKRKFRYTFIQFNSTEDNNEIIE